MYNRRISPKEAIQKNAQLMVATGRAMSNLGADFGYDRKSVEWVESFIERERGKKPDQVDKLVQVIGSFLGESIIETYGGNWGEGQGTWGVFFDDNNVVYPFNKVRKQFENGLDRGDSILGFFDTAGLVMRKEL